jgi:type IV secretion system protein TrbC
MASLACTLALLLPAESLAQAINVPFVSSFGCSIVQWMRGPLAILVFILVVIVTLVVGMISRMDWGRIIAVVVIFGVLVSLPSILASSSYISGLSGMNACLQ